MKQHEPWLNGKCLHFLDQRKKDKMQWVLEPNQSRADSLHSVRREASRHFRKKEKEYLKAKID